MSNFLQKIKQIGFYKIGFLAIIGIIVVLLLGSIFLASLNSARTKTGGSIMNPLSAPGYGISDFLIEPSAEKSVTPQTVQAQEGHLTQRKIIKNGSLFLLVKKIEDSVQSIQSFARTFGGFVGSSQVYENSAGMKFGTITIRVPADRFEEAMAAVKNLAVKVEREDINENKLNVVSL